MITNYVPGAYMIHDQLHVRGGQQVTWLVRQRNESRADLAARWVLLHLWS